MTTDVTTSEEVTTSQEDKFFGVKTTIDEMLPKEEDDSKEEIIIEEAEEEAPVKQADREKPQEKAEDDEIESYSKNVQKRIDKLTWQFNEEKRQRQAAEAVKNEAVRVAQTLNQKAQSYENIINTGEATLIEEIKSRAALAVDNAKNSYRKAYEEGNTEEIIKAQETLTFAQAEQLEAMRYEGDYQNRMQQFQQAQHFAQQMRPQMPPQMPQQQRPQIPEPTPESKVWADKNPWFGKNEHRDMTALAYAEHERLIRDEGIKPDTDEYYEKIDNKMREIFPSYFKGERSSNAPPTVVAPGTRNNGAKPRTVRLSPSERSVAKALGLTDEQYAKQLLKEKR